MRVEHTITVTARCPVNKQVDVYRTTIRTGDTIPVEKIIAVAHSFADREVFQEALTEEMATALDAQVTTVGFHSGVRTEVTA